MKKIFLALLLTLATSVSAVAQVTVVPPAGGDLPRFATPPTCTASSIDLYFDTDDNKVYWCNGTAWSDLTLGVAFTFGTANTYVKVDSGGTDFADGLLTDDGTDLSLTTGASFLIDADGTSGDDSIIWGATSDLAVYYSGSLNALVFEGLNATGGQGSRLAFVGNSSTAGATIASFGGEGGTALTDASFAISDIPAVANGGTMISIGLGQTIGAMSAAVTTRSIYANLVNADHTNGTWNMFEIVGITQDAQAVETAILIGAGWDTGLAILGDGSATDDNISLGASLTTDAQIYFDGTFLTLDVDGATANSVLFALGATGTLGIEGVASNNQVLFDTDIASAGGSMIDVNVDVLAIDAAATINLLTFDVNDTNFTSASDTVFNFINIEAFTQGADADVFGFRIGANTPAAGDATAIVIEAGWDHSLSILGDGSATDDNITLGASITADAQIYFDGTDLVFDVNGTLTNGFDFILGNDSASIFRVNNPASANTFTVASLNAVGIGGSLARLDMNVISELSSDIMTMLTLDLGDNEFDTATGSTFDFIHINTFTPDSHVDYNGLLITGITPAAGTETAISIGAGWDYGLSILGDGSAITNNITLGSSLTADVQLYFDGAGFVIDLDGTAGNTMDFQIDGDAAASRSMLSLTGTFGILNGSDTQRGLDINMASADHTGTGNTIHSVSIRGITGDPDADEIGLKVAGSAGSFDLAASFDGPVEFNTYRQDFDGPCFKSEFDWTAEVTSNGGFNQALCMTGGIPFVWRLDGAQSSTFIVNSGSLDIDNNGVDDEGVEFVLDERSASPQGWSTVGTSPAMYVRARITITSVSGTDNFAFGWRLAENFIDNMVIASYDTYGAYRINDVAGNIVIQTGDDTVDATDEEDQVVAWADAATHILEVRLATDGTFTFFIDGLQSTQSTATGAAAAGDIMYPFFGQINAADADTETSIDWIEIGEVI